MQTSAKKKFKFIVFSLLPAVFIVAAAEIACRFYTFAAPAFKSTPLPGEYAGLNQPDELLFWSLKPNMKINFQGVEVITNSLGLRSPQIKPKQANEFRILSLGESTSFGAFVGDRQTYAAQLEMLLNNQPSRHKFTVINAAVSAYSSFQSFTYLKKRGLKLQPDMVLFYHELNDYLPSSLRDSSNNILGVSRSDMQLYQSRFGFVQRVILKHSALCNRLNYKFAQYRVKKFQTRTYSNPLADIGLPDIGLQPRLVTEKYGRTIPSAIDEKTLPTRVTPKERSRILKQLYELCRKNKIRLVIIHPSYRSSSLHKCILTKFAKQYSVPIFEVYNILHPDPAKPDQIFVDHFHPNVLGHELLAKGLLDFLHQNHLLEPDR